MPVSWGNENKWKRERERERRNRGWRGKGKTCRKKGERWECWEVEREGSLNNSLSRRPSPRRVSPLDSVAPPLSPLRRYSFRVWLSHRERELRRSQWIPLYMAIQISRLRVTGMKDPCPSSSPHQRVVCISFCPWPSPLSARSVAKTLRPPGLGIPSLGLDIPSIGSWSRFCQLFRAAGPLSWLEIDVVQS